MEYTIVHSYLTSDEKPLQTPNYKIKTKICSCALEKTESEVDFTEYQKDENKFLNIFENKVKVRLINYLTMLGI